MEVGDKLLTIKQGKRRVAGYALEFCTIATGSSWNEPALKAAFWQGLNPQVLTELVCQNEQAKVNTLINLAICLDNLLCN